MMVANTMFAFLLCLCLLSDTGFAERSTNDGGQCLVGLVVNQALQLQQYENQLQQQASQLQQQESKLQELTDQLQRLTRKLKAMESTVERNAAGLMVLNNATKPKQVAFSARYSKSQTYISVGKSGTLKYDTVVTNIGNRFSPSTGIFTAPYAGVYTFYASLRSSNTHGYIVLGIFKSSTQLVMLTADGKGDLWDRGNGFVTTHLDAGEQAYVRHIGGDTHLETGGLTTFSGVLVAAD
ncbi:uncharacterized protein LOC143289883 [Babylonia areolata]|uniref:uncharacterized protein LOC143289883 n=1 Tax=Babylonia areolata TaxID=304850 RepID=UPI003FCFFE59